MADTELIREKPRDYNAERSVIGAMLLDKNAIVTAVEKLQPDDFYDETHKVIFKAILEQYNSNKATDLVSVLGKLKEMGVPEEVCRLETLSTIVRSVPTSAYISDHCDIVAQKAVLRRLIDVTEDIGRVSYKDQDSLENILDTSEKKIFEVLRQGKSSDMEPIESIVSSVLDNINAAAKNSRSVTGVSTGFFALDYMTSGFQNSDLIILAARPAMGKTALALNIAEHVAIKQKIPTVVFSLEMSRIQIVSRILSMNSGISSQSLRTGRIQDGEWERLFDSADEIAFAPLFIDDTSGITVPELRSKCRKLKAEKDLGLIIIDYLQLMTGSSKRSAESRQQEISEISRALKGLAREINCPVIALSQLSRQLESRPDKRPMLSDLRESGAIEQDADVVTFIYRDEYYNKDNSEKKGIAEIIIAKQRNGPTGTVELGCKLEQTRFLNLEYEKKS